jgi:hypothetical protein
MLSGLQFPVKLSVANWLASVSAAAVAMSGSAHLFQQQYQQCALPVDRLCPDVGQLSL